MLKLHTILLSLALLSAPAFADSNLLTNGDFETGDFTGWSHVGEQWIDLDYSGVAHAHGDHVFYDGTTNGLGSLSQSFATVAGASYTVEFDLLRVNSWGTPDKLDNQTVVKFGGATLMNQTNTVADDWVHYTFNGVSAAAASTALQFNLHNYYDYTEVDNISVVMTAVPEPSMALMLAAGLLLLVRRRAKVPPPF